MDPIFPKWVNKIPFYLSIFIPIALAGLIGFVWYYFSPKFLAVGYQPNQPVLFSHKQHAGSLGIDCRYCHSTVEKAEFAALPSTATCMGCHNKVKANSPRIALVKSSFENNTPIPWVGIYALPRYAHFPHNSHVNAGVGCVSCHGRVDEMDLVYQATPMSMGWCLECHRNPSPSIVPKDQVTNLAFVPNMNASSAENKNLSQGTMPLDEIHTAQNIQLQPPTYCSACHY